MRCFIDEQGKTAWIFDEETHPKGFGRKTGDDVVADYVVPTVVLSKPTREELFKLTKKQQEDLLRQLGVFKFPRFEAERVSLILSLS